MDRAKTEAHLPTPSLPLCRESNVNLIATTKYLATSTRAWAIWDRF